MKIPVGNFGFQVAQPAPRPRLSAGEFDRGSQTLEQAGHAIVQAGLSTLEALNRQAAEEARQASEEAKALAKAEGANAILDHETEISAISEDIKTRLADGSLKHGDAATEYRNRVSQIKKPTIEGMDPVTQENFSRGLKRAEFSGEKTLNGAIAGARTAEFRSQTDGLLDRLGKKASLPGSSVEQLNAYLDTPDADAMGRQAYGAAWDKKKQDWKDANWDSNLNQKAMASRNSIEGINALQKQITEGVYADKLDSNRRNALVAKLDVFKTSLVQRQAAEAHRAEAQQQAALKRAEAEYNVFQGIVDKGTFISPEYVDKALKTTAGTPYQKAILDMANQAKEIGGLASMSLNDQRATLRQIDTLIATNGRTPALDKRRDQVAKVVRASEDDYKDRGIEAGLERGVITSIAPIDASTPAAIAATISNRIAQAEAVSARSGMSISPFTNDEADKVAFVIDSLSPREKSLALFTLGGALPPRMKLAVANQLAEKNDALQIGFLYSDNRTTYRRFATELIFKGATALKDKSVSEDNAKIGGWKGMIGSQIDSLELPGKEAEIVKKAAHLITAGIASENGGTAGVGDVKRAIGMAVGGQIVERQGRSIVIPAGLDEYLFEYRLKNVSETEVGKQAPSGMVRVAGVPMPVSEFVKSIPGQELMNHGRDKFVVIVKGRPVMSEDGKPITIKVK